MNRAILNHLLHDAFADGGVGRRPGRRPRARPLARPRADRGGARPLPVPRQGDGLSQPDGPGPRGQPVPLAGPLPPLPRRDRPPAAPGRRPGARPRHGPDQPGEGLGLARRQGDALGAVQLQPAHAPALRRALLDQPVPLRDPDQQPGDDRRPDGLAGRRPLAAGRGDPGRAGRALPGGRGPGADPPELPEQGVGPDRDPRHPPAASRSAT